MIMKAMAEATGRNLAKLKEEMKKEGDLGLLAQVCGDDSGGDI